MVKVWCGDEYIGEMTYDEYLRLVEANRMYWCEWCEGYGP